MTRVLIADDDAHIVRVMMIWLTRFCYEVFTARNGQEGLDILRKQPIDLILSDMNMPVLDGVGLARAVREQLKLDIPIVVLSARCDQQNLVEELSKYRVQVFPKPFLPSQLMEEINRLIPSPAAEGAGA